MSKMIETTNRSAVLAALSSLGAETTFPQQHSTNRQDWSIDKPGAVTMYIVGTRQLIVQNSQFLDDAGRLKTTISYTENAVFDDITSTFRRALNK